MGGLDFDLMHASETGAKPKKTAYTINPDKIEMVGVVGQTPAYEKNLPLPLVPISTQQPTTSDAASATAASGTSAAATTPSGTPYIAPMSPLPSYESTSAKSAHTARPPSPTDTASINTHINVQASPLPHAPNLSNPGSVPGTPIQPNPSGLLFRPDHPAS